MRLILNNIIAKTRGAFSLFNLGLTLIFLIGLIIIYFNIDDTSGIIIAGLSTLLSGLILMPIFKKNYKIYEPFTILILLLLHGFLLQITMLFVQKEIEVWGVVLNIKKDAALFQWGLLCYILAIGSFLLGYLNFQKHKNIKTSLFKLTDQNKSSKSIKIIITVSSIVAVVFLLLFTNALEGFSWFGNWENFSVKRFLEEKKEFPIEYSGHIFQPNYFLYKPAEIFSTCALLLGIAYYRSFKKEDRKIQFFVLLAFLVSILCSVIINNRSGILTTILGLLVIVFVQNKNTNLFKVYFPALGFAVVMGLGMFWIRQGDEASLWNTMMQTLFWTDFLDIKRSSFIINAIPSKVHFLYGESLIGWTTVGIPRTVWAEKPIFLEQAHIVSQTIFESNSRAGIYPGLISELYWNFHVFGIAIGCFILGWLSQLIYQVLEHKKNNPSVVAIYSLFLTHLFFFSFSHSLGMGILKFLLILIPLLIVFKVFKVFKVFLRIDFSDEKF